MGVKSEGSFNDGTIDGGWWKEKQSERQTDVFVGGRGSDKHCHLYVENDTGKSGVVHRGECDDCAPAWFTQSPEAYLHYINGGNEEDFNK